MSRLEKLLQKARQNPQSLRFEEACRIAEAFGFHFRGGKGSHRVYARSGVEEFLNFQNVGGKAKPYQVKQMLRIVEERRLKLED